MFSLILANKTADFEAVLARVKEALAKSQDPKRKQQALSWRVLKGAEPGAGGNIVYIWFFDPAVKDVEYSITSILTEAFPNEAQDLWAKYIACFASPQSMLNLTQVLSMGPAGTSRRSPSKGQTGRRSEGRRQKAEPPTFYLLPSDLLPCQNFRLIPA